MPKKLMDIIVDEISLVDDGANPGAKVLLMKRKSEDLTMTLEELQKAHDELKKTNEDLSKKIDTVVTKNKELSDGYDKLKKEMDELSEENMMDDKLKEFRDKLHPIMQKAFDELSAEEQTAFMERFDKGDDEEEDDLVNKAFKKFETRMDDTISKLEKSNKDLTDKVVDYEKRDSINSLKTELKELDGFVEDFGKFVSNYYEVSKVNKEAADSMLSDAKRIAKMAKEGGLFKVIGKSGQGGNAEDKLDNLAKEYSKLHKVTFEKAYARIVEDNPDLYSQTLEAK